MSKVFNLNKPRDLLTKLRYDVSRIGDAENSAAAIYAALDCANDAWHMVDWVLASSSPEQQIALCGQLYLKEGASPEFAKRYADTLPRLATCKLISNGGKHLVLRKPDDSVSTSSSLTFEPPFTPGEFWAGEIHHRLVIEDSSGAHAAQDFFSSARADWESFLPTIGF